MPIGIKNPQMPSLSYHHSIDAARKLPGTLFVRRCSDMYISFMCGAECETRNAKDVTMLLCTMAGIVERIRKEKREKIAHDVALAGSAHADRQMLLHFFGESAVSSRVEGSRRFASGECGCVTGSPRWCAGSGDAWLLDLGLGSVYGWSSLWAGRHYHLVCSRTASGCRRKIGIRERVW